MSPITHARANENKLETDSPTFSSCVGDFGRLFLSVSMKHGLRTADYGLRTGCKIRTRYKTRTRKYGLGIKHGQGIKRGLRTADWV